ncbi:MAG: PhoD-like phosphatase N-terminal domain-containing protein [Ilumatobacteraceae bacterium]
MSLRPRHPLSRRQFLAGTIAATLAACSSDDSASVDDSAPSTTPGTDPATTTTAPTTSPTPPATTTPATTAPATTVPPTTAASFCSDPFTIGVAPGDPLADRVILWTRLLPDEPCTDDDVPVDWEVATDPAMTDVVASGTGTAIAALGHSVHVDAEGLRPDTEYWYRFRVPGFETEPARTRTFAAPGSTPERFRFALVVSELGAGLLHGLPRHGRRG